MYVVPSTPDAIVFPGLDLGAVLVTVQPPRGFGSDPIGTYHGPDVPPPHHYLYLAFYRWLDTGCRRCAPPVEEDVPCQAPGQQVEVEVGG